MVEEKLLEELNNRFKKNKEIGYGDNISKFELYHILNKYKIKVNNKKLKCVI